jgi:GNAT superfamily N-acetyltransferase
VIETPNGYHIEYLADYPACAEEVGHLKYREWLHTSPDRLYEVWIEEIRASALKDGFPMTLLVLEANELVGFVTLVELEEKMGIEGSLWLITLYVKEAHRGRGVGSALIARCIAEAGRMGHAALYLWTESSYLTRYYERRGWRLIGQDEDGEDVMVYELAAVGMPARHVQVRPVRSEDASDLRKACFPRNTLEEVQAQIAGNIERYGEQKGVQLVAVIDGKVIGTMTLIRNAHALFAHRADLYSILVDVNHQRQGMARRMLEESRRIAGGMDIEILETSCRAGTGAETAYARMGFIEYGRLPRGIIEPWGERQVFDQVYYYLPPDDGED